MPMTKTMETSSSRRAATGGAATRWTRGTWGGLARALALALSLGAGRGVGARAEVVRLDLETYARDALRSREPWVVYFTGSAEKCAICEEVSRQFVKASESAVGTLGVRFGTMDVTAEGFDLERLGRVARLSTIPAIEAYPTTATLNPYDARRSAKMAMSFPIADPTSGRVGDISSRAIATFAERALPTHLVERVNATSLRDASSIRTGAASGLPTAVILTNKPTTSALLKSMSHAFEGRMRFVEVAYEGSDAPALPGAEGGAPRLGVYPADGSAPIFPESDSMKREVVMEFLNTHAGPEVELKMETIAVGGSQSEKTPEDDGSSGSILKPVTATAFVDEVLSSKKIQIVAFTKAGERCGKTVDAVPEKLSGFVAVVGLREFIVHDDDDEATALVKKVGAFKDDSDRCVEIVMFPKAEDDDDDAREPVIFTPSNGDSFTRMDLEEFIRENLQDNSIFVTANTMDKSLFGIASTAPRVIMFMEETDQQSRDIVHVASAVHKDFIFGVITEDDEALMEQFQITSKPSLLVVYRETQEDESNENMRMSVQKYPLSELSLPMVNAWLLEVRKRVIGVDKDAVVPMPKSVDTPSALDEECAAKGGLCVVAFIKNDDASQLMILHTLAKDLYGKPYHFAVVDPVKQRTFASVFDVNNPVDYPTVAILATRTSRYATHKGAFEREPLREFCANVLSGKVKTWRFQEMPKLVEGGEKVEEVVEEIIEEEFDLSDIMGEEVEGEAALSREQLAAKAEEEAKAEAARRAQEEAERAAAAPKKKKKKRKGKKKKTEL